MSYDISQIKEAYKKLKSYIYYDNTDILLRRKLVEFESNLTKDGIFAFLGRSIPKPYKKGKGLFNLEVIESVEEKLQLITDGINTYNENPEFIKYFLKQITIDFFPKNISDNQDANNYVTNKKVYDQYRATRLTAFINAPIEIHIISVLWIIENGISLDKSLNENCFGNRLLLNKTSDKIVQGSSLFRPYFKQYQKWRDNAVDAAKGILKENKNALFLSIDIKDYFHSARIQTKDIRPIGRRYKGLQYANNLKEIFTQIHIIYTEQVANKYHVPCDFSKDLRKDENGKLTEVVLPIGLLSSYVLANHYLRDFDNRILQKIKPAYYGRYVDDILLVIADPNESYHESEVLDDIKFDFDKYKDRINKNDNQNETVSYEYSDVTRLEKFVLHNFTPVIQLVDNPNNFDKTTLGSEAIEKVFKLNGYPSLYCQSSKSLIYFFEYEESDLVIDKLKKDLEEKISEFRDFPDEEDNDENFDESAYHLFYDGSEGKILTLKDYKENRYGLTVYLANKIFSALRHENKISIEESLKVLRYFRGINCLTFFRLWEKIFTYFIVNEQAQSYVEFYIHCTEEVLKFKGQVQDTSVESEQIHMTLLNYLDCAHELALSLNPTFINKTKEVARHFEYRMNKIENEESIFSWLKFEPTTSNSYWGMRFRLTNMIRHHYCIHPLLTYTTKAKTQPINLTTLSLNVSDYILDNALIKSSPRPVKYWECCLATVFENLSVYKEQKNTNSDYVDVDILSYKSKLFSCSDEEDDVLQNTKEKNENLDTSNFYLDDAYRLYVEINTPHLPGYVLDDESHKNNFFKARHEPVCYDNISPTIVQEIQVSNNERIIIPSIAFANTKVVETNIIESLREQPNLSLERYQKLSTILKKVREERADILLFPEFFIPVNLVSSIVRYSEKNQVLTITGLEHVTINKTAFNFLVSILPVEVNGITDAVVVFRLKNHYAHIEESMIRGNHYIVPKPKPYRYDVFNWKNIYFSPFYCFELANVLHRSLMKGKLDLLVGIEWNKDTPYFSNIVEAGTRDLHCYIAQVNTSQYGDTRLTQPVETSRKDLLRLKGGYNDSILVEEINIDTLREFQRQKFSITHFDGKFKPLPPDYRVEDVLNRINNKSIL